MIVDFTEQIIAEKEKKTLNKPPSLAFADDAENEGCDCGGECNCEDDCCCQPVTNGDI